MSLSFPQVSRKSRRINSHSTTWLASQTSSEQLTVLMSESSRRLNMRMCTSTEKVHTINVQAVCDADLKVINLVAKYPGSAHDAFIWRNSSLHYMLSNGHVQGGWLLGESLELTQCCNSSLPHDSLTVSPLAVGLSCCSHLASQCSLTAS